MTLTLYVPADPEPAGPPTAWARVPLPSVAKMQERLRADPRFRDAFGVERVLPAEAELVLGGLLAELRRGAEPGAYRPIAALAQMPIEVNLARAIGWDTPDTVGRGLDALQRVGIVRRLRDGALTVELPDAAVPPGRRVKEAVDLVLRTLNGPQDLDALSPEVRAALVQRAGELQDRGGRPRKGETRDEARERRAREHAAETGQRNLRLIGEVSGPKPPGVSENLSRGFSENLPEVSVSEVSRAGFSTSSDDDELDSTEIQGSAHRHHHGPRAGENQNLETSKPAVVPKPETFEVSETALRLAARAVAKEGLKGRHAGAAPGIIQDWLNRGFTEAAIAGEIERRRSVQISTLSALEESLASNNVRVPGREAAAPAARAEPAALHPGVAANPAWAGLPRRQQLSIGALLEQLDAEPSQTRWIRISSVRGHSRAEFDLVAAARPELEVIFDAGPDGWKAALAG